MSLYPGIDPVPIVQEAGWAPGPVWTGAENLAPNRDSVSGPSSQYRVAIPTEISRPPERQRESGMEIADDCVLLNSMSMT